MTVLDHLWQSSLFAGLIWALTLLFRNNSAAIRHGLWFAASAKFLVPFSLLAGIGRFGFSHPVPANTLEALARIEPIATPFAATAAPVPVTSSLWIIATIWGLGALMVLLVWTIRALRLSALVGRAIPLDLEAPIRIKATPQLLEPGLVGIFRPVILLPQSLTQKLSRTEIDAILAHELCHWRRRDNLLAAIHMLVEALFWFHPLVWFIGARLTEEREQACDESVLEAGKKPFDYAQAILKVCRLYIRSPLPCAAGVSGADLERRISAIMKSRDADEIDPRKILLLTGLGLATVMTPLVLGALKPMPMVERMTSRLAQILAPAGPVIQSQPVREAAPVRPRRPHHMAVQAPVQERQIIAPAIDASMAVILLPAPHLPEEPLQTAATENEALVCRRPQLLPASHLPGPRTCLPQRVWDQYKAEGVELMPDGRTLAQSYEKLPPGNRPGCKNVTVHVGSASSALSTLNIGCDL